MIKKVLRKLKTFPDRVASTTLANSYPILMVLTWDRRDFHNMRRIANSRICHPFHPEFNLTEVTARTEHFLRQHSTGLILHS